MAIDIEALLRKRYGQDRFQPVAGQTQMTFQEWMDRHPSLQGPNQTNLMRERYDQATSAEGGQKYIDSGTPASFINVPMDTTDGELTADTPVPGSQPPTGGLTSPLPSNPQNPTLGTQLPAQPDQPPKQKGSNYRDFLNKSWGKGAQSTRTRAAAFRRNNKGKGGPRSTSGNTQQAH